MSHDSFSLSLFLSWVSKCALKKITHTICTPRVWNEDAIQWHRRTLPNAALTMQITFINEQPIKIKYSSQLIVSFSFGSINEFCPISDGKLYLYKSCFFVVFVVVAVFFYFFLLFFLFYSNELIFFLSISILFFDFGHTFLLIMWLLLLFSSSSSATHYVHRYT